MLRRLHPEQPQDFAFTPANRAWAEAQITKYPEGRQASAIIPLLWRAQEQEGWLTRPAIEHVADMLGMAYIRALEVATFYFMFQLQPVGSVAHFQICGTTSCMICGAEDLIAVCREKIAANPHELSQDGKFSWEEVECLGACANAPMAQIGKDYYEDLNPEGMADLIDRLARGDVPRPGPQNGRFASEPKAGLTSLQGDGNDGQAHNASVDLALSLGDTIKRIDGTEVELTTPWKDSEGGAGSARKQAPPEPRGPREPAIDPAATPGPKPAAGKAPSAQGATVQESDAAESGRPAQGAPARQAEPARPAALDAPHGGRPDDLRKIKGIGPKLEGVLNSQGIFHYRQIAGWTPEQVAYMDANLEGFRGRASRDDWVGQASRLAEENVTGAPDPASKGDDG